MSLIGVEQALAALMAGLVCVVPGALFAWQAARTHSAARVLRQGVAKLGLTIALMVAVIAALRPQALGFFSAFVAAQAAYVVGPLLLSREGKGEGRGA